MKRASFIVMLGVLGVLPVGAGQLALEQVSSEANWVVHIDSEWFRQSRLGGLFREGLSETGAEERMENFAKVFSFHPLEDIHSITLYGQGQDEGRAVVMVRATFDKEVLLALVGMNKAHQESEYGEHVIHSWVDEKEPAVKYGSFYSDELVVMGGSLEAVERALDVLEGKAENAQGSGLLGAVDEGKRGVMIRVGAQGVAEIVRQKRALALKQTEALQLAAGEKEEKFYLEVNLTAKSAEAAENIGKMLRGIIAFGMLAGEEHPKLAEMARAVELYVQGKEVKVYFSWNSDEIYAVLKEIWQKRNHKAAPES